MLDVKEESRFFSISLLIIFHLRVNETQNKTFMFRNIISQYEFLKEHIQSQINFIDINY